MGVLFIMCLNMVWGTPNRLPAAVVADLKKKELLTGCRALGPWLNFTMMERPVLELNQFYSETVEQLTKWSTNASDLVQGVGRV